MFRFQRTARIRSGKGSQAIQWAKDITKYLNENYPPASSQAYMEVFGDYAKIHLNSDFEDLATLEKVNAKLMTDREYMARIDAAGELFIEGATQDTLIQSL